MLVPRRHARRRTTAARAAALLLTLSTSALALTACSGEDAPTTQATAPPTPIARLNTDAMRLVRIEFCSLLPRSAVKAALDGRTGEGQRWRSGQDVAVSGDAGSTEADAAAKDVVHENGCRWSADGYSAAAWLFADPVTTAQARTVLRASSRQQGCTTERGPDFGSPSQLQSCRLEDGSQRERYAGLFGDTWLTCEVQAPAGATRSEVRSRAGAWCVQVANATNTTR